jgi:hypothetical protein
VNTILGDIQKGVTTRSRVAHFCEYYSFVSSIEPYRMEDALRDSDWVLAMQEKLNNFTRNEVWHLVPRPNQNVVGTKWVFRNKQDEHGVVTRNKPIKSPRKGSNKKSKRQPKAALVWHTGLSGVPPYSVRCTTKQCPVHQGESLRTCHLRDFWNCPPL